ncbi:CopG family transcriptional regulator [Streptomyces specialis]|uniref:CopG family transcriptional regulator n=1 Tax=Streptomyces specialis TaxID=498367 RepID=UPI000A809407|nr:CopG family transcriptional regulator [Streptomyces specialis]
MALKKTTVMVDEEDLALIKEAAAREGRPVSGYFREAFHLVALRALRWDDDWDIPRLDFGRPVTAEEIHRAVADGVTDHERSSSATPRASSRPSTPRIPSTRPPAPRCATPHA